MQKELFIKVETDKIKIALLEDKRLVEYVEEPKNKQINVGDYYIGKVKRIVNSLNAAFVDIGYERDAFLYYHDLGPNFLSYKKYIKTAIQHPKNLKPLTDITFLPEINKNGRISEVLLPNELILVQVTKEPIDNKGPRVTTEITIPGRHIVLVPFKDRVFISQKIKSKPERQRLQQILENIRPRNFGIIARTASQGKDLDTFKPELDKLIEIWNELLHRIAKVNKPQLIMKDVDRISAYLRDVLDQDFSAIYVNDQNLYYDIKDYLLEIAPQSVEILKFFSGNIDMFDYFGINHQIHKLLGKIVPLKKGAYLVIEKTEALHVIDVNSGHVKAKNQEQNAFEVNLMAVEEIARQLRLRDIGGIIIIDFIDMKDEKHREEIYQRMKKAMKTDRAKHTILPLSKFGIMQITRQRLRPEVITNLNFEPCPVCNGTGQIGPSILLIEQIEDTLKSILEERKIKKILLKVHPFIHAYLTKGIFPIFLKWAFKYKVNLNVKPDKTYYFLEFNFFDKKGNKITT